MVWGIMLLYMSNLQRYITHVISLRGRMCCICAGVQVCRCAGVQMCRCAVCRCAGCRCADVQVCRCAGVTQSLSVPTLCNDCKVMLLLLFIVKTGCRGDNPCDLINGKKV